MCHNSIVLQETELRFRVVRPASCNLINWHLNEVSKVGKIQFEFNKLTGLHPDTDQASVVMKNSSISYDCLEVIVKGCGVNEKFKSTDYDSKHGVNKFFVEPKETGTLDIVINVYKNSTDTSPNKTFRKKIEVKGWNIEIYPREVVVGTLTEYRVIVTDERGYPVNNARISLNDEVSPYIVDGTTHNIIGGVYKFKEKFTAVGPIKVEAVKGNNPQVSMLKGINIIGEEVYSVVSDTDMLLNAFEENIYITVIDEDGDIIIPSFERIDVTRVDGKDVYEAGPIYQYYSHRKDLDKDGEKEAIRLKVKPTNKQHTMIIRAVTNGGKRMGQVKIKVQPPQVIMRGTKKLTENFKRDLEFEIIDPRNNEIIDQDVYFVASSEHVVYQVRSADNYIIDVDSNNESDRLNSYNDIYKCKIYVDDVNFKKLKNDDQLPVISMMLDLGNADIKLLDIPIGQARLTSDPDKIIMNTGSRITLTYEDAEGSPLNGYDVMLGDDNIGETNSNGQFTYITSAYSSRSLSFTAKTDDKTISNRTEVTGDSSSSIYERDEIITERKVKSTLDLQKPVVTYTVNGNTALITITDNVRVERARINGKELDMFFASQTVKHEVTNLKKGKNIITVEACDGNFNAIQERLVINIESVREPVVFRLNQSTKYGVPKLVNSVTMVPVRFVEQLGVEFNWNNQTRTVTYTYKNNVISVTIGSNIAIVNGKPVKLKATPYLNELGRSMVPLRTIATDLGFEVIWNGNDKPITIK